MTIPSTDMLGPLIAQLNKALRVAFPSVFDLRSMVMFEWGLNLDEIAPAQASTEEVVFVLVNRVIAENWVDELIRGACRQKPHNEQLRAVAEALGISTELLPTPSAHVIPADLLLPYKFDLTAQVQLIADNIKMQPGQLVGFVTYDNDSSVLGNLRQRLEGELGGPLIYCHPTIFKISRVAQSSSLVLKPILAHTGNRLREQDVIFIIDGLSEDAQLASFWSDLQAARLTKDMPGTLVVIFACEPDVSPPAGLHRLHAVHFTQSDVYLWISRLVNVLDWDRRARDIWFQTVLQCTSHGDELVSGWVYEHLSFASKELPGIKKFDAWEVKLQEWSQYYV